MPLQAEAPDVEVELRWLVLLRAETGEGATCAVGLTIQSLAVGSQGALPPIQVESLNGATVSVIRPRWTMASYIMCYYEDT